MKFASINAAATSIILASSPAFAGSPAQPTSTVSPMAVIPPSLAPAAGGTGYRIDIPEAGHFKPPNGSDALIVTLGDVYVEGVFPRLKLQVEAITKSLRGQHVSLAEVYAAAARIEALHAQNGYVLARVSVPPQTLTDGAALKLLVTDGYIEDIEASNLPKRIQSPIHARAGKLVGRRQLKFGDIETLLMRTSDLPGLALRSTLMRGDQPGGAKLVLEGQQSLISGSFSLDNQVPSSLGGWDGTLQIALNSAFGLGEQIYGFASSGYQVNQIFDANPRERVLGTGLVMPLGIGALSLNPELTFARTTPTPPAGAPATTSQLRRLSLRASGTFARKRNMQAGVTMTIEQLEEVSTPIGFSTAIGLDRYMAARLSGSMTIYGASSSLAINAQFSQGLGDVGAIGDAAPYGSGSSYTRQGATPSFSKASLSLRSSTALGHGLSLTLSAKGQTNFGQSLFRAEQLLLEGDDGLSAYVGGSTALDMGGSARGEISLSARSGLADRSALIFAPYIFASIGAGRLQNPTAVEQRNFSATNWGVGLRATLTKKLTLGFEFARGLSPIPEFDRANRLNTILSVRF